MSPSQAAGRHSPEGPSGDLRRSVDTRVNIGDDATSDSAYARPLLALQTWLRAVPSALASGMGSAMRSGGEVGRAFIFCSSTKTQL